VRGLPCVVAAVALCTGPLAAQTIPIRTVPVASGDQFLFFPSETLAMGGLEVAVHDSLADAWTNPARGRSVPRTTFIGSPSFYSVTNDGGSGRTYPVGVVFNSDQFFGGAILAAQQIESTHADGFFFFTQPTVLDGGIPTISVRDTFARNVYASVYLGSLVGDQTWSFGMGFSGATLEAMDGVERLYAAADRIQQAGTIQDARIGFHRDRDRERVSLLFLVHRVSMTHDVAFTDASWDDVASVWTVQSRLEHNDEKTQTVGVQVTWDRDIFDSGWTVGASAKLNRNDHPAFPNYEIQDIFVDPGKSSAYEIAVGVARIDPATKLGLEVALRPIWSETWKEADARTQNETNGAFLVGDHTFESSYRFVTWIARAGASRRIGPATVQFGLEGRSFAYTRDQVDLIAQASSTNDEAWAEWTPSFGAIVNLSRLDVRYTGRVHTGDIGWYGAQPLDPTGPADGGSGTFPRPATLRPASVVTHQFSVLIPVG
jgi:hypothetical protein